MPNIIPHIVEKRAYDPNVHDILAIDSSAIGGMYAEIKPHAPTMAGSDILVFDIQGPLEHRSDYWFDSYEAIRERFDKALTSSAKTIILRLDTPGGQVSGCFELAEYMKKRSKECKKTLIAYSDGTTCSAGYAIACSAERIVAPKTAIVGSIGVIVVVAEMSKLYEEAGYKIAVISSGKKKAEGSPYVPLTEDAVKSIQSRVNELADIFFSHVSASRNIGKDKIKALEAAVFVGESAKKAGLVDSIMSFDELISSLTENGTPVPEGKAMGTEQSNDNGAQIAKLSAELAEIRSKQSTIASELTEIHKCLGTSSLQQALGVISGLKESKVSLESIKAKAAALEAEIQKAKLEKTLAKAEELYPPSVVDGLRGQSIEFIESFMKIMPESEYSPRQKELVEPKATSLSDEERRVADMIGITHERFQKEKVLLEKGE